MGVTFQQKAGAEAPQVEDGLADAIFLGITPESHPDWAGPNKFGGQDDGERWRFAFNLTDDDGDIIYDEETRDPIEVDRLTTQSVGKKATAYGLLKGIMTPAEVAIVDAGEPFDGDSLEGRPVQVIIAHNDKNWPYVESVVPARKKSAKGAK